MTCLHMLFDEIHGPLNIIPNGLHLGGGNCSDVMEICQSGQGPTSKLQYVLRIVT